MSASLGSRWRASRVWMLAALPALSACLAPAGIRYAGLPTYQAGALHVVVFDVGQADSMLILYKGKSLLIDCGSPAATPLRASRQITRRLDALLGGRHVDYYLTSHYHQDHVGAPGGMPNRREPMGLYSLVERDGLTIGTLLDRGFWFIGEPGATQKHYERAAADWQARGIVGARRIVHPGDTIDMGDGLDVRIVAAAGNGWLERLETLFPSFVKASRPSENDYSVAVKVTLGRFEMFTAGDLSGQNTVRHYGPHSESYNDIESRIAPDVGPIEVYRVDHHGSSHSSNPCFTQTLHPQVSIFSTGFNHYGHPSPDTYKRLKGYGDVYITGGVDPAQAINVDPHDIVGDDVEILVQPDGGHYWVNGHAYTSLSDAEELARPMGTEEHVCPTHDPTPESFTVEGKSVDTGD